MTQKTNQNPWTMDVRVRERNLKSGALTDKDLEKHLAALPDVADQSEPFNIAQPALTDQPQHIQAAPVAVAAISSGLDDDDDDDLDDDDDDDQVDAAGDGAALVGGDEPVVGDNGGGDASNGGGEPT